MSIKFVLWWFVCFTLFIQVLHATGISAQIRHSFTLKASTKENPNHLTRWSVITEYGFYQHSSSLHQHETGIIQITKSGIYFLAMNLMFERTGKEGGSLEVAIREIQVTRNVFCYALKHINTNGTVNLQCFTRLKQLTKLEISVHNKNEITVKEGSTLSIQYIGNPGDTPSLVLPLTTELSYPGVLKEFRYFNSFTVLSNLSSVTIPCTGIYYVSIAAVVAMKANSYFEIAVNNETILHKVSSKEIIIKTVSFLQPVKLHKDSFITIKVENAEILKHSSYAILKLGDKESIREGLSLPISNVITTNTDVCLIKLDHDANSTSSANNIHYAFSDGKDINRNLLQIKENGLYLIMLQLNLRSKNKYFEATITGSDDMEEDEIDLISGLSSTHNFENKGYSMLNIQGVLHLRANSMLSIKFKSCDAYTKLNARSFLSLAPVSSKTYSLSSELAISDGHVINCRQKWIQLKNFIPNKKMYFSKYLTGDEFIVPSSGVYFVYAYVSIKTIGDSTQKILLLLRDKLATKTLYSIRLIKTKTEKLNVGGIVELKRGDVLKLFVTCKTSIEIVGDVHFDLTLLHSLQNGNYLIAKKNQGKNWKSNSRGENHEMQTLKSPGNGVFLVTYSMHLNFTELGSKPEELVLRVFNGQKDLGLNFITYMSSNEMESEEDFTLEVFGYLKLKKDDSVHITLTLTEGSKAKLSPIEETFSCALVSNVLMKKNGFKTIQRANRMFQFINKLNALDNFKFSESSGGFKLHDTKFFGPYFVAVRPSTVLYHVSVHLQEVIGVFRLCIRVRPKYRLLYISSPVVLKTPDSVTLTATGILQVARDESLQLLVYGDRIDTPVLCTRSSWSLMDLSGPSSSVSRNIVAKDNSSLQTISGAAGIYTQTRNVIINDRVYDGMRFIKHDNKTSFAATNVTTVYDSYFLTQLHQFVTMYQQPRKTVAFNVRQLFESEGFHNQRCVVTIVENILPNTLIFRTADRMLKIEIPNVQNVSNFFVLAMCRKNKLKVLLDKSGPDSNKTVPVANFVALNTLQGIEGFSATILVDQKYTATNGFTERLDGWITSHHPFFDVSNGYKEGSGMFIPQENGYYFITMTFHVKISGDSSSCQLIAYSDDTVKFSTNVLNEEYIVYANVLWLQRNSALQLKFKCPNRHEVTVEKNSKLSVFLVDTQPSFDAQCIDGVDKNTATTNINGSLTHVALTKDFVLKCSSTLNLVADFIWEKDGKVIKVIRGKREGSLLLTDVQFSDNGTYTCKMERGKSLMAANPVKVIVVDPRPVLTLSKETVYVKENVDTNKLVAWVTVHASNMITNEPAEVMLSIVEGNDDNNFYFSPSLTNTFSTLLHRRPFNYELRSSYKLTVKAETFDMETTGFITKNLTVYIMDENEHKPKFINQTQICKVKENSNLKTKVCKVTAFDEDPNTTIKYSIYFTSIGKPFAIDELSGDITVKNEVDYEISNKIDLIVSASDGLFTTYQHINVLVVDDNDNKPIFKKQEYKVTIFNNGAPDIPIIKVTATDRDSGKYGVITYKIVNDFELFRIHKNDGNIFVQKTLLKPAVYKLKIEGKDQGDQSLTDTCVVIVTVVSNNYTFVPPLTSQPPPPVSLTFIERLAKEMNCWEFWVISGLVVFFILFFIIVIVLCCKYHRTKEELKEFIDNQPDEAELEMKSFLLYTKKPAEAVEASMYISSETLPSAYSSSKNLTKIDSTELWPMNGTPHVNGKAKLI